MKLYRSLHRIWTGTQADAKAAQGGADYETIEVPTDKPSLIAWLNEFDPRPADAIASTTETAPPEPTPAEREAIRARSMERFADQARKLGWTPPGEASPIIDEAMPVGRIEDAITDLQGDDLLRTLSAAMSRLNEVAGVQGWRAFAKRAMSWGGCSRGPERGLGLLLLAGLAAEDRSSD